MNGKPAPGSRPRAVFFGTPGIAVPSLDALTEVADVVGVVTQPDRPAGRGLTLQPPAVKTRALELGLELTQPLKVRDGTLLRWLEERRADVLVVLAYGRILPPDILRVAAHGALNLHASLLPRHRGAAPIAWSIIRGDEVTGISLMQMDEGMDTGAVLSRHSVPIGPEETAGALTERLAALAAFVVRTDLPRALARELVAQPQDAALATNAPPLKRDDGRLDFAKPARELAQLVRGLAPKPGAHTTVAGKTLSLAAALAHPQELEGRPGEVRLVDATPWVLTGQGALEITRAKLEGRREVSGRDLVNGRVLGAGTRLGG